MTNLRFYSIEFVTRLAASLLLVSFWLPCIGCQPTETPGASADLRDLRDSALVGDTTVSTSEDIAIQPALVETSSVFLASFNIQVFGQSKLKNDPAMQILTDLVRRVDVLAVQEIRSSDQSLIPKFMEQINADGSNYRYLLGPRLGRTKSKEQYAFIYDATRIEPLGSAFTVADPNDEFHREPMVARFKVRSAMNQNPFTFTLINMHTDPDEADMEVDALAGVYQQLQQESEEDDIFLLGDLNVSAEKLGMLSKLPGVETLIKTQKTNTRGTKTYDHFILNPTLTTEYLGNSGVVDIENDYDINVEDALKVSDHLPIWAEFSSVESTPTRVASDTQPQVK